MLNLSAKNIQLNASAQNKEQAIHLVAEGLVSNGNVATGYETGMLARETQTSTFLGNGIAIPHGTLDTRDLVLNTGVQIYQFPNGIEWGEGNIAYVVIGIAAKSDEHLNLLRQLTTIVGDEQIAETLAKTTDIEQFIALLSGKSTLMPLTTDLISLNIDTSSLLTLSAINAAKLQEKGYVNQSFISDVLASTPLMLSNNVYLVDSPKGNLATGIALARSQQGKILITVSATDDNFIPLLTQLIKPEHRSQLTTLSAQGFVELANNSANKETKSTTEIPASNSNGQVVGTFTVRNEHGLHARPSAVLVQTLKPFEAKISVENLDRPSPAVNAKSTMRIVSLGATKAHRLRFIAEGPDAQQAIEALAKGFAEGLGENITFVPETADSIENTNQQAVSSTPNIAPQTTTSTENSDQIEAIFTIENEHGLHARPSAVLVNEVKKYNATIQVQNLDRESQLISAKSLMKIIALGVQKGHRLRFVATGEEAQKALDGIGEAIRTGLGE
ncbi:PTS fructose transporter subunit IIA [Vespertiliibacter pulmonis]|uniref:Multiphosphoryl transfer protein n=1 Tax=Vespertiliibacter pulmonis TaxID=1443036 RepID=A0A3N4VTK5_9PAST|nr:fused PTS fructose transporter subunit IIA/HPr protein [Vespertiliibacter pulmonis]QLB20437.1 PTS fructose transporter subunit IIA [Vespertiliibacter pulmonis]RPE86426.1 phosphocarrier protein HPr /PTS system D-fructose-specific IIA component (F1P-forming) (Frc family) [Vespertiliibacter pulmonis]